MKASKHKDVERRVVQFGPLTFVYYRHPEFMEAVSAHCLELNIGAHGSTKEEATRDLQDAIEEYVLHTVDEGEKLTVRPAPEWLWQEQDRQQCHLLLLITEEKKRERKSVMFTPPPPQMFAAANAAHC